LPFGSLISTGGFGFYWMVMSELTGLNAFVEARGLLSSSSNVCAGSDCVRANRMEIIEPVMMLTLPVTL
jgi:hypothetical protein